MDSSFSFFPFQTAVEMRGSRNSVISSEVEYGSKPAAAFSRSAPGLRYHACMEYDVKVLFVSQLILVFWLICVDRESAARTITSLPVSPCSSPLRQHAQANRSNFPSPPHPSYGFAGAQNGFATNEFSMFPMRLSTRNTLDPWTEIPQFFRAQTPPNRSPRTRPIL